MRFSSHFFAHNGPHCAVRSRDRRFPNEPICAVGLRACVQKHAPSAVIKALARALRCFARRRPSTHSNDGFRPPNQSTAGDYAAAQARSLGSPIARPASHILQQKSWSSCCAWRFSIAFPAICFSLVPANSSHAERLRARPAPSRSSAAAVAQALAEASKRFTIPEPWLRVVMRAESGGHVRALSEKGAVGLMQIMPKTYAALRTRLGLGPDPFDPHDNIVAGAAYLREMFDYYGSPGFLAAYNAGPGRYEDHLATGRPLPFETRIYVAHLAPMMDLGSGSRAAITTVAEPIGQPLFVALASIGKALAAPFTPIRAASDSSFSPRSTIRSAAKSTPERQANGDSNAPSTAISLHAGRGSDLFPKAGFLQAKGRFKDLFVASSASDFAP